MRWLALLFLCLNILLWYFADVMQPPVRSTESLSGTLPRVASLKTVESNEGDGSPQEVAVSQEEAATITDPEPPAQQVVEEVLPLQCVRMGWLESKEAADALVGAVQKFERVRVVVDEVERERPPLNWVLIPPQPPEIARRQFRDIQRQGIDSYLVTEGEYRNAISLGLFESRDAAISVLEEKKRQNLNAVLAKYNRNQISYALDFEAEPDLAEALVQAVTSGSGKKFDFIEINPCEGVATPEKTP